MFNILLDGLFPARCVVCDAVLTMGMHGICADCSSTITPIHEPYCMACGKQLTQDGQIYCKDCNDRSRFFRRGRAFCVYDDPMKKSMYRFKYDGRREYAEYYASCMADAFGEWLKSLSPDALIPIPIHESRKRKRGYNQAELLAESLSKSLGIPCQNHILKRLSATKKQKELSVSERENNLKKAFKTTRNDVELNTAILIDDIYTTGATIDAAAAALVHAGVRDVYFATMCVGRNS